MPVDQQYNPNVQANGSDNQDKPWINMDSQREEEMTLERYQALSWNLERSTHLASSVAHDGGTPNLW